MTHLTHPRRHHPTPAPVVAADDSQPLAARDGPALNPTAADPGMFAVLDALSDVVCITTSDGTLRFLNRAGRELLGYVDDDSAVLGCLFPAHTPAARALLLDEVVPAALRHGSATCDTALQTADGRVFPASQTVIATLTDEGLPASLTIVIRDVSIERQAAARLGDSQRLFEMITRSSPDLIYLYDPIDERIVWMNRCPHAFLGGAERDARTLSRREMHELVHPDDRAGFVDATARMAATYDDDDVLAHEMRVRTEGGEWHWLQTRASAFSRRETGAPLLLLGVATDVSARKLAELHLIAARDTAQRESHDKNEFLLRISAEFRVTLQAIIASATDVHADRDRRLTARERDLAWEMITAATRMLGTVSDLHDLTCIENGEMPVHQALADARCVILDSVAAFADHPAIARMPIVADLPEVAAPILTDPLRLRQALSLVIANVLSSSADGRVTVSLRLAGEDQRPVAIDVHDSRAASDESSDKAVFDPFASPVTRATSSIQQNRGTGLGLALARSTCEMLGGSLTLASDGSQAGSTFRISLPTSSRAAFLAGTSPLPSAANARGEC